LNVLLTFVPSLFFFFLSIVKSKINTLYYIYR
jgi:hypothetical protein